MRRLWLDVGMLSLCIKQDKKDCLLVRVNWFEFYSFISINPPACGTSLVQVFLDMVPAEAANLFYINYPCKTSIYEGFTW